MNIKSLTLKNELIEDNGEKYLDLSAPCFDISNISILDIHLVTQDEEGRPDKICEKYYGSTEYIDVLCFVNRIFNPFSIKTGELIIIPQITSAVSNIYFKPVISDTKTEDKHKADANTNEKDINRVTRLSQQKISRKPNELPDGTTVKKYINGKIVLGTHLNTNHG